MKGKCGISFPLNTTKVAHLVRIIQRYNLYRITRHITSTQKKYRNYFGIVRIEISFSPSFDTTYNSNCQYDKHVSNIYHFDVVTFGICATSCYTLDQCDVRHEMREEMTKEIHKTKESLSFFVCCYRCHWLLHIFFCEFYVKQKTVSKIGIDIKYYYGYWHDATPINKNRVKTVTIDKEMKNDHKNPKWLAL